MGEQRDRMLRGDPYRADDPELVEARHRCQLRLLEFNAAGAAEPRALQERLLSILGSLGEGAVVLPPLYCDYGSQIEVGARTFVNYGAVILDCAPVVIGDDVQMGPGVQLLTAAHPLDAQQRRSGLESAAPIVVASGAWLGGGVIVCPGVSIGTETVVGAGSVVTRDLPPGVLAVGNPCRVLRQL